MLHMGRFDLSVLSPAGEYSCLVAGCVRGREAKEVLGFWVLLV